MLERLEVAFELPYPRRRCCGARRRRRRRSLGRTTHRTLCSAQGMSGVRFEPARSTQEACTGFRDGLRRRGAGVRDPGERPGLHTLAYACRGSGVHLRMEPGTLTFPNAVSALAEVATPREVGVGAVPRQAGGPPAATTAWTTRPSCGTAQPSGAAGGRGGRAADLEEDEGLYELLLAKYGPLTPTLQFTEQPVWTQAGRRHALVLLATQGVAQVSRSRLRRLDPFGGGVTVRSEA